MRGTPQTMQDEPAYADVVGEVTAYLRQRRDVLLAAGIAPDRIAVDPGIGFGKTARHNLELAANAWQLHALGCPVLVGHSRKRFIATAVPQISPLPQAGEGPGVRAARDARPLVLPDPTAGTIGVALSLARQRVQVIRVHDVAAVRQALLLFQATGGLE